MSVTTLNGHESQMLDCCSDMLDGPRLCRATGADKTHVQPSALPLTLAEGAALCVSVSVNLGVVVSTDCIRLVGSCPAVTCLHSCLRKPTAQHF